MGFLVGLGVDSTSADELVELSAPLEHQRPSLFLKTSELLSGAGRADKTPNTLLWPAIKTYSEARHVLQNDFHPNTENNSNLNDF